MVEPIAIGLVAGGLVLLFFGAVLSIYTVGLLGALLGGGIGYLAAPTVGDVAGVDGTVAFALAIPLGALVGIVITFALLSTAIAAVSFIVGIIVGLNIVAPALDAGWQTELLAAFGAGIIVAGAGMFFTRSLLIVITSFIGSALASRSLTMDEFEAAQDTLRPDPIVFDLGEPLFVGLFVLGVLSQFGLFKFGYVTKLVSYLPGASVITDSGRGDDSSANT
jgi:hypothetical protein